MNSWCNEDDIFFLSTKKALAVQLGSVGAFQLVSKFSPRIISFRSEAKIITWGWKVLVYLCVITIGEPVCLYMWWLLLQVS